MTQVLNTRRKESQQAITQIREALAPLEEKFVASEVAMYATGSFGRLEASWPSDSDLDVFFIFCPQDRKPTTHVSNLDFIELSAGVIGVARDLKFPRFSRDGAFLRPHNLYAMGGELGSSHEDANNGFTARLLLLLEGRALANEALYEHVVIETISFYYRDFPDNRERFRPYVLVNDILRYWRTLCLNYEHQREKQRREAEEVGNEEAGKAETLLEQRSVDSAIGNLKLRYSRLALCFSMIAMLVGEPPGMYAERVREMCRLAPTERWAEAAKADPSGHAATLVPQILDAYEEFLLLMADPGLRVRLKDPEEREQLRRSSGQFGDLVFQLLQAVASDGQFRRLVV